MEVEMFKHCKRSCAAAESENMSNVQFHAHRMLSEHILNRLMSARTEADLFAAMVQSEGYTVPYKNTVTEKKKNGWFP